MKLIKSVFRVTLTLVFSLLLFSTAASTVKADPNTETVTYAWSNTDSEGTTPANVVTSYKVDDKLFLPPMIYTGYTIDPNKSYLEYPSGEQQSYADIFTLLHINSIEEFINHNNQGPSTVGEDDLGLNTTFFSVLIPNDETVTINYVSTDGKNLGSKTIATKFSRIITIDQPSFDGYTISANQPTSYKVVKDGAGANVVTITYAPTTSSSSESSSSSSSSNSGSSSSSSNNVDSSSVTSNGQSSSVTGNSQSSTTSSQARTVVPTQNISSSSSSATSVKQTNTRDTSRHASLPSTAAIGYTTSIIGVAILAGVTTFFVIKRRNR
ncbi:hypothetical protein ACRYI5_01350 [Furfurilactobacillus sp. WILCCON 0119]